MKPDPRAAEGRSLEGNPTSADAWSSNPPRGPRSEHKALKRSDVGRLGSRRSNPRRAEDRETGTSPIARALKGSPPTQPAERRGRVPPKRQKRDARRSPMTIRATSADRRSFGRELRARGTQKSRRAIVEFRDPRGDPRRRLARRARGPAEAFRRSDSGRPGNVRWNPDRSSVGGRWEVRPFRYAGNQADVPRGAGGDRSLPKSSVHLKALEDHRDSHSTPFLRGLALLVMRCAARARAMALEPLTFSLGREGR